MSDQRDENISSALLYTTCSCSEAAIAYGEAYRQLAVFHETTAHAY